MNFDPEDLIDAHNLASRPYTVQRLRGGAWNEVFRVISTDADIVIKRFVTVLEGTLFPNLPHAEALALERLSGLAVAPDPIRFFPETNWGPVLVYRFHEGESWSGNVGLVADLLKRKLPVDATGFRNVPLDPGGVTEEGDRLFARCSDDRRVSRFQKARPQARPVPALSRRSLIHTDVGPTNLIDGPKGLRLIDWQCPAAGDPAEDVFSFLTPAWQILSFRDPLSAAERNAFLQAYNDAAMEERLNVLEPAFIYRAAGYCCLRYQLLETADPMWHALYTRAADAALERLAEIAS
ncbi:MAG: phosphotransferase [Rhizobiales bacterium]|nr:phosphotransferase [Hyphomicrobiales bacterium]